MPDVPLWPQCNIGCVFCSNPVEGFRETTERYGFEEIRAKLDRYKAGEPTFLKFDDQRDYFNLTGGEPTIHPEFHRVLALIRSRFPGRLIRLLTNGRMLHYEEFARRTVAIAGLPFEAAVPLFGFDARSHEATSRAPGSFDQTVSGLRNLLRLRRPGQLVEVRVILTRPQLKSLEGLFDFLLSEFPELDRLALLFVELEGFAERYSDRLVAPMSEVGRRLEANLERLRRFREARLYHFPLCVLPTGLWPFVWNTLAPFKVTWLDACRSGCLYREACVGVHRSYVEATGAPDVAAIREARPVRLSGDRFRPVLGPAAPRSGTDVLADASLPAPGAGAEAA